MYEMFLTEIASANLRLDRLLSVIQHEPYCGYMLHNTARRITWVISWTQYVKQQDKQFWYSYLSLLFSNSNERNILNYDYTVKSHCWNQ